MLSRYGFGFEEKNAAGFYYTSLDTADLELLIKQMYYGMIGHITMDERIMDGFGNGLWLWSSTPWSADLNSTFVMASAVVMMPTHPDTWFRGFSLRRLQN